jgi:hypothetical protein
MERLHPRTAERRQRDVLRAKLVLAKDRRSLCPPCKGGDDSRFLNHLAARRHAPHEKLCGLGGMFFRPRASCNTHLNLRAFGGDGSLGQHILFVQLCWCFQLYFSVAEVVCAPLQHRGTSVLCTCLRFIDGLARGQADRQTADTFLEHVKKHPPSQASPFGLRVSNLWVSIRLRPFTTFLFLNAFLHSEMLTVRFSHTAAGEQEE